MQLQRYAEKYRRELLESVVPFWLKYSLDREYGGYFTCLDRDGTVYDDRKYLWLQGRAIWMFSKLYNVAGSQTVWLDAAKLGADFVRKHARDAQGRCYFSLTRDGLPFGNQRKPYAAVFIALGLLEYSKATGDDACRREALELFWSIREWIADPMLLGRPAFAAQPRTSVLADVMVTASLALEISEVETDARYTDIMKECLKQVWRHYDADRQVLLENAPLDDFDLRKWPEGRLFCPGDCLEMCWFLLHIMRRLDDWSRLPDVLRVMDGALEAGWDREYGGLLYFIDIEGRPPLQLEADMKLWWPHTEAIYSLVLAYRITGDDKWLPWLERVDEYAFAHFADPEHGEWFGYCDRVGRLTNTLKGNNYKGCFHVPRAMLLAWQAVETANAPAKLE